MSLILPSGFSEAVKDKKWKEAMDSEMAALTTKETWRLVQSEASCKWVYKQKF